MTIMWSKNSHPEWWFFFLLHFIEISRFLLKISGIEFSGCQARLLSNPTGLPAKNADWQGTSLVLPNLQLSFHWASFVSHPKFSLAWARDRLSPRRTHNKHRQPKLQRPPCPAASCERTGGHEHTAIQHWVTWMIWVSLLYLVSAIMSTAAKRCSEQASEERLTVQKQA